ncbi:MAG: SPOR domain-containing protein [Acidobacteriia bacterium]|nr:SPOR domain-containing protein [Terriglobia bacterium]
MDQRGAEAGTELVLDNRKLILGFMLLIVVCGAFFVIGFMEGKRQAVQARVESTPSSSATTAAEIAGPDTKAPATGTTATPATDRSVREQLDWYKSVQSGQPDARKATPPAESAKAMQTPETKKPSPSSPNANRAAPAPAVGSMIPAAKVGYSVQAGAFRERREAEIKADALKAKGFPCVIEAPKSADQLYLVKVGKFESRADAVAMQKKLQKAGFPCFIKTN